MRDLKFRGWNENKNGWVEFFDLHIKASSPLNILDLTGLPGIILEQFTGLLDKHGKEIYEGDIIKLDGWSQILKVSFIEGAFCFAYLVGGYKDEYAADIYYVEHSGIKQAAVIGNIHENMELYA